MRIFQECLGLLRRLAAEYLDQLSPSEAYLLRERLPKLFLQEVLLLHS